MKKQSIRSKINKIDYYYFPYPGSKSGFDSEMMERTEENLKRLIKGVNDIIDFINNERTTPLK